jgi:VWFA-related protein
MRITITACLLVLSGILPAQIMHLDVVVRDGHSRILHNLEPADFAVRENDSDATIRGIKAADPKQKHFVSLLFDRLSGEPARLAREAAFELLNASAKSNVQFGIFEAGQTMRVRQSFTGDGKALRKAVDLITGKKSPPDAEDRQPQGDSDAETLTRSILRASTTAAAELRERPAAAALLALIRGEAAQSGRKAIVYFSQGFPVDTRQEGFRVIVSSANRAGVAIYTVDAAALAVSHDEELRRAAALQSMIRYTGEERARREGDGGGAPNTVYQQTPVSADRVDRHVAANASTSALSVLARSTSGFFMENNTGFRAAMRRVAEELTGYYEITYVPRDQNPDGSFRATRVDVKRDKAAVQGRDGYFATPDLSGRPVLPYEVALLGALQRNDSSREFTHRAQVLRFRGEHANLVTIAVEVPAGKLKFQQDDAAGVYRARVAVVALVRAADGTVVDRLGGDTPILCPPGMVNDMRRRFVSLQKQMELPEGKYVLETAAQDRLGESFSTSKTGFTVGPAQSGLGLSSVTIARAVTPASGEEHDAGLHLADKNVQPALDGVVTRGAPATVYFKVYPQNTPEPVDLAIEVWQGEKRAVHSTQQLKPEGKKDLPQVLAFDLSRVPMGAYELRVIATQGANHTEERTPLVIEGGDADQKAGLPDDTEVAIAPVEEPKSVPPTAEQQRMLETVRENALKYSQRLPNFICTQSTRRMIDSGGKGDWRTIEEASDLLSFYDGQEHYSSLTTRAKAKDGEFPASVSSAGEFGSMLKEIFDPASNARFAWVRREQVRGRAAQVFSYVVDASHSRYRVTYRGSQQKAPVFAAFRGQVAIDPETATVLRLTLTTDPLAAEMPVRQISIALDYDEVGVADQIYLLPISATIDVRLHKKTLARNEVTFRSFQRFSADSRITFQTK